MTDKKHVYHLGSFNLDLTPLWTQDRGPRYTKTEEKKTDEAVLRMKERFRSKAVGFYDLPNEISQDELSKMKTVARRLKEDFQGALLFGIGGSYLGPAALIEALRGPESAAHFPMRWLSNIDGESVRGASRFAHKKKVASVLISKSGTTVETLAGFIHLSKFLDPSGIVVITDPQKGDLRRLSQQNQWPAFSVPPNVGGRFSVLTPVGLFPAMLADLNVLDLIEGAKEMRTRLEESALHENAAFQFAWALYLWDTHLRPIQYLMPYQAPLKFLADWWVQLWGESLGKRLLSDSSKSVGPTPVSALGTTDQHSLLQLFREGPSDKVIGFLNGFPDADPVAIGECQYDMGEHRYLSKHTFEDISHKASLATEQSLRNGGVPTYRIEIPRLNEKAMGALMFFFETACAFAGELYGVDAFNQPGVEESKKLLRGSL